MLGLLSHRPTPEELEQSRDSRLGLVEVESDDDYLNRAALYNQDKSGPYGIKESSTSRAKLAPSTNEQEATIPDKKGSSNIATSGAVSKFMTKLKKIQSVSPEDAFGFNEWGGEEVQQEPSPNVQQPFSISIGDRVDAYFAASDEWAPARVEDILVGDDSTTMYTIRYECYDGDDGLELHKPENELRPIPLIEAAELEQTGDAASREGGRVDVGSVGGEGYTGQSPEDGDVKLTEEPAKMEETIQETKLAKKEEAARKKEEKAKAAREEKERKKAEKLANDARKKEKALADKAAREEARRLKKEEAAEKARIKAEERARRKEERMMKEGEKLLRKKAAAEGGTHQEAVEMLDAMNALGGSDVGDEDDSGNSGSSSDSDSEDTTGDDGTSKNS